MRVQQITLDLTNYYTVNQFNEVYYKICDDLQIVGEKRKTHYYNIACAFDIETTSFFRQSENSTEPEKVAIMYVWTFSICGYCVLGRTWEEFTKLMDLLAEYFNLSPKLRIIIYVHNLGFDFSFFRKWLVWENVFSAKSRTPIYAVTNRGIEFRCSYLLSGYKLETIAEKHLSKYTIKKLVGDLDYDLIRHSKTPLSNEEIQYCLNDVKIIVAYIQEKIDNENGINNIPYTKTGYVRQYCRNNCFYENGIPIKDSAKEEAYHKIMRRMNLSVEEYYQLKRGFQGGFTHANPFYVGKTVDDVTSFDFTSSYPAVMLSEKFPMCSSEIVKLPISYDEFMYNLKNFCCLFELELWGVESVLLFENYISRYRCRELKGVVCANGRVVKAEHLKITVTEQDYFIIEKFYKWRDIKIANFRRYRKCYLPKDFVLSILKLYKDKTELKGVKGSEIEYLQSKEMINACYGMTVTDIVREEIEYINNMWPGELTRKNEKPKETDAETVINKYNKNRNRFLFYPWGVWVTAYARKNLFTGILEFGNDYIYSDTDSIKVVNAEKHKEYIEKYNHAIYYKVCEMLTRYKIPISYASPQTIKGIKKPVGVWENEGTYKRFKTLGAKRYMVETDEGINITVSGLNKSVCVPYILSQTKAPFEYFRNEMNIPGEFTGKKTHTYIDDIQSGVVTDYLGNAGEYYEKSSVHLSNSPYCMSMVREFIEYLAEIKMIRGSGYE